ncbi:MAG: hypothetical protein WBF08_06435 [Candidatus Bathyarchaeia archaeon]|jgi:hypothetical protein
MKSKCRYCKEGQLKVVSPAHASITRYQCEKCSKTEYESKPAGLGEKYIKGSRKELEKRGIIKKKKKEEEEE